MKHIFTALLFMFVNSLVYTRAQPSPENSNDEKFKVNHGPYLQHLGETEVTFVWTTNKEAVAWVELAPDDSTNFYNTERKKYFSASHGLKNVDTIHVVHIGHLQPGTKYRYRIFSQEVLSHKGIEVRYGEVAATRVFMRTPPSFRTNDHQKKDISFLMVNDIHERNEMLKTLLKGADWTNTDLVLFDGDMVNSSRNEEQMFASYLDTAVQLFASQTPMYYARGNHETRGEFADAFAKYFPGPNGKLYYMFRQGPVCFIMLDSGEDKPDSDIEYGGITAFDVYRDEQAAWLKEAIHSKMFTEAPFKIAVAHIPPFRGWHGEEEIANKFVPLLNEGGIDVMLCAHLHRFVRKDPKPGDYNFPVIVNSNHSVLKAKADNATLKITIVDANGSTLDSVTINRR
ncbi:MAG: metallophosphoesterase [Sphingobacteriales bacterium]|nr:metallophosphoesterase [Sphingobacteriales bacterium]